MSTENSDRIARNINKMEAGGASEAQIQAYVDEEKSDPNYGLDIIPSSDPSAGDYIPDKRSVSIPFMEGATLGSSDELTGGIAALYMKMHDLVTGEQNPIDWISGKSKIDQFGNKAPSFKENYATARDQVRADQAAFAKENPKTDFGVNVAGSLLTGGYGAYRALASNIAKQAPKLALPVVAGVEGAMMGAGEGEGLEDSLTKARNQGITSVIAAPILNKLLGMTGRYYQKGAAKLKRSKQVKTIEDLHAESQAFFDLAEESGIKIRPGAWAKFIKETVAHFKARGVNVIANPKNSAERGINSAIRKMMQLSEPSYQDLAAIDLLLDSAKASSKGSTTKAAYKLSSLLDDFIENLTPGKISAGNLENLSEHISKAKSYWSRMKRATTIKKSIKRGELSEAASSDGDFDKAMRSQIRSLVDPDSRKSRGMGKDIITSLEQMITGTKGKNLARIGARMDPGSATRRGISPTMGAGLLAIAGGATLGPSGVALGLLPLLPPVLGGIFKSIANHITKKEIKAVENALLNKDIDSVEEIIRKLYSKYEPFVKASSAALAANQSEAMSGPVSTLSDMISP